MSAWVRSFLEAEADRAKQAEYAVVKRDLVSGSELTAAQLAEIQPALRRETRARHPEWFGEAAA